MKRKLLIAFIALVAVFACAFGFTACDNGDSGSVDSNNGTYYSYEDGKTDKTRYITLNNGQWRDPDNAGGTYKINGTEIIFYVDAYGTTVALFSGTCSDGRLVRKGLGAVETFYKEGCAPSISGGGNTEQGGNTEHKHSYTESVIDPTCTEKGYTLYTCTCGENYKGSYINALGHSFTNYISDGNATCTEDGTKTAKCERCDETDTVADEDSAHGHDYVNYVCIRCKNNQPTTVGLEYSEIKENGEVVAYSVSGIGKAKDTDIVIPSAYNGKPVTIIGNYAFYACKGLTSVIIPNSVTSIDYQAFYGCSGLTSVTIGNSVTSIEAAAFLSCSRLTSIAIPDSVTSIGYEAFECCSDLTSVQIGKGVIIIGGWAFRECGSLTSIIIPNNVTSIGDIAFEGCSGLTSIIIPNSVTSIGYAVLRGCSGLTSITVAAGNKVYHSDGNCLIETSTKMLISGCKNSVIPTDGSVTSIGSSAFWGCSSLTNIIIPDSVTSIGSSAFHYCSNLTSITFKGTKAQWNAIKASLWNSSTGDYTIHCTDGDISK